jgi:type VI secretion system protein ImpH
VALEDLLTDYFDLKVEIEQAQGQWLTLDDGDCSCMPGPNRPEGCNNALGVSLFLGERVWDVQSKFRVRVGPLRYAQFRRFMPDGDALEVLCHLTRTFAGLDLDFDVLPVLRRDEAPRCRLGGDGDDPSRLGWNTWVHEEDYPDHLTDAVFTWMAAPAAGLESSAEKAIGTRRPGATGRNNGGV